MAALELDGVTVESGYQLQIEDAALIAEHDVVVFADAHQTCGEPFELRRVEPEATVAFSTHSVPPRALLALAREHFGATTLGYTLGVRAHELDDFGERLSERGRANLRAAVDHLTSVLREGSLVRTSP